MGCASSQDKPGKARPQAGAAATNGETKAARTEDAAITDYTKKAAAKNFGLTKHTIIKVRSRSICSLMSSADACCNQLLHCHLYVQLSDAADGARPFSDCRLRARTTASGYNRAVVGTQSMYHMELRVPRRVLLCLTLRAATHAPPAARNATPARVQPLGVGGTGETWLVRRNDTGQEEAVKVISRGPLLKNLQRLLTNEITLQAELSEGNVNIVDAHEVLLTETHLCLFMEYIAGGTLTDYVSNRCETTEQRGGLFLDEMEARYLFRVRCGTPFGCVREQWTCGAGPRASPAHRARQLRIRAQLGRQGWPRQRTFECSNASRLWTTATSATSRTATSSWITRCSTRRTRPTSRSAISALQSSWAPTPP